MLWLLYLLIHSFPFLPPNLFCSCIFLYNIGNNNNKIAVIENLGATEVRMSSVFNFQKFVCGRTE